MTFKGQSHVTEEGDLELHRAIEEMKHLDEILSKMISREKEIKRQRKEFQARLWQDFLVERIFPLLQLCCLIKGGVMVYMHLQQNKPDDHSECTSEAVNTRLFLALETLAGNKQVCTTETTFSSKHTAIVMLMPSS